jgi:hypothetical protein
MTLLSEKPRLGFRTSENTPYPDFTPMQSQTALGDSWTGAWGTRRMSLSCEFGSCDIGAISSFASGVGSLASAGSCLSSSFGLPGAGGGAITVASLPTLSTGVKIGESPTVGTSILSTTLRTLLPQRNFGSIWAPTIGNIGSRTPVLGGAVSRWAGWVGVAVTTYQTGKFINCLRGSGGGSPGIGGGGASGGAGASGDWFH